MEEIIFNVQTVYVHNSSYNLKKKKGICLYVIYTKVEDVVKDRSLLQTKNVPFERSLFQYRSFTWFKCFEAKLKKLLNGVIGFTCHIC